MYWRDLRAVAPELLLILVVGAAAGVFATSLVGSFDVPKEGPPYIIFTLCRSVGLGLLGSIVLRRILETLAGTARTALTEATGDDSWIPVSPDSALIFHWRYRRADDATREVFGVLLEESPGVDAKKLLQAAQTLSASK